MEGQYLCKVIGLTGGIASGKSTVLKMFKARGIYTIEADLLAHEIYQQKSDVFQKIVALFGPSIVDKNNGDLDRKELGNIVFNDPLKLKKLTDFVWPAIDLKIKEIIRSQSSQEKIIVLETAVLYKAGWDQNCDEVWAVVADESLILPRVMARNHSSREETLSRIQSQDDVEVMKNKSQVLINNNGTLPELEDVVEQHIKHLI